MRKQLERDFAMITIRELKKLGWTIVGFQSLHSATGGYTNMKIGYILHSKGGVSRVVGYKEICVMAGTW